MAFSSDFKINVNKLNSDEILISLARFSHSDLSVPVCLVNDSQAIVFEGEDYIPFPFTVKLQDQVESQAPVAQMVMPNFSKQITKWIDETVGARGAVVEIIITRRSSLLKDYYVSLNIKDVSVNSDTITFSLESKNKISEKAIRWKYDNDHAKGLF